MDTTPSVWSTGFFRTGPETCLKETDDIHDFFAFEHRLSMTGANGSSYVTMPRFKMVRRLTVQSSDLDHEDLASKGIAIPLDIPSSSLSKLSELWAIFYTIRNLEVGEMNSKTLTLTLDEEEALIRDLHALAHEAKCRRASSLLYFPVPENW
jgi:hypothetical protein